MRLSEKGYLLSKDKIQSKLEKVFQKFIEYEPIDWQVDFKSGYRWSEKTYYKFFNYYLLLFNIIEIQELRNYYEAY